MTDPARQSIPRHIAIIMDGNGRWASERGLPRKEGHRAGAEAVREAVEACNEIGVRYLTLYAFSSENWNRPKPEVAALMTLLERFLKTKAKEIGKKNVQLKAIGRLDMLPKRTRNQLDKVIEQRGHIMWTWTRFRVSLECERRLVCTLYPLKGTIE